MRYEIDDSASLDELKVEEFLDFIARMIARRWMQEERTPETKFSNNNEGTLESSSTPHSSKITPVQYSDLLPCLSNSLQEPESEDSNGRR